MSTVDEVAEEASAPVGRTISDAFSAQLLQRQRGRRRLRAAQMFGTQVLVLVVLLGLWQLGSGRWFSDLLFSSPAQVAVRGWEWIVSGKLQSNLWTTTSEAFLGFAIGTAAGIVIGIVLGSNAFLGTVSAPYLSVLYATPKIALGPLFVVWLGVSFELKVGLAALFVCFMVSYTTWSGVREVDKDLIDVLRVLGAGRLTILRKVILPSSLVWVITGLRISFPHALAGAVVGELLAANEGIGFLITNAAAQYDVTGVLVAVISLTIVAAVLDGVFVAIHARFKRW